MTEKLDLKKFIKKNPWGFVYLGLATYMMIIGFLFMDGFLTPTEEMTTVSVFGFFMVLDAAIVIHISSTKMSIDKHEDEIEILKGRLDYLEDKIYSGSGTDEEKRS